MEIFIILLLSFGILFESVQAHGDHDFKLDPNSDESRAHLQEDLDGVIDKKIEDMDAKELQFHYFRQHDYDKDEKLDGLELVMSITHHETENPDDSRRVFTDSQLQSVVDGILKHHDKNNDGYMDFTEYITPFNEAESARAGQN